MPAFYGIEVEKENVRGELCVNDVPLFIWPDDCAIRSSKAINGWIQSGFNTVSLAIKRLQPRTAQRPLGNVRVRIVFATQRGISTREATEIARLQWPSRHELTPDATGASASFHCENAPQSEFWPSADRLRLDARARSAASSSILELNDALATHQLERVIELLDFKARESAHALWIPREQALASQRNFFAGFLDQRGFTMREIEPKDISFRLVADGRLVWATRMDGSPALQSVGTAPYLLLPLYVAPVNNRWTIVR